MSLGARAHLSATVTAQVWSHDGAEHNRRFKTHSVAGALFPSV